MTKKGKIAVIAGAGPAGLTTAYELLTRTDIHPIILEKDDCVGGISRTVEFDGNYMDIGGHRFFSKSDRVMGWWLNFLPLEDPGDDVPTISISYQNKQRSLNSSHPGINPESNDQVMLIRNRLSRILYRRKFFDYPVRMNLKTIKNLGIWSIFKIGLSYVWIKLFPRRPEKHLEDFFINRFGKELFQTFFKDYTEKVWGVPCSEIEPEWGAQRIKGLSVSKALGHALRSLFMKDQGLRQKQVETSLIDKFLYPKYGPGQLWQIVASEISAKGGEIRFKHQVDQIRSSGNRIISIIATNTQTQESVEIEADYLFSTMPVKELITGFIPKVPKEVAEVAAGLEYRDFITVGILLKKMKSDLSHQGKIVPDNWIYVQESDVKVGRIQIFNNWSPWLVKDPNTVWLGLEYFCQEGDSLWQLDEDHMLDLAIQELSRIGLCDLDDFIQGTVVKMPKTYPAYFGTYYRFPLIREFTDKFENLYLLGRNGMHKYNNQDHSMLTAMIAVDNLVTGILNRDNIWSVNTEDDYHEEGAAD